MTSPRRALFLAGLCLLAAPAGQPSAVAARPTDPRWVWPLEPTPTVIRGFDPPQDAYAAGHRGVDLSGSVAQPVLAIGAGVVTFARAIAGRGVVVVDHGDLRSTYEPVTTDVAVGQAVDAGDVIGLLQATHSHCLPDVCLHLGIRRGDSYLDPLSLLGPQRVRLKPVWSAGPGGYAPPTVTGWQPDGRLAPTPPASLRPVGRAGPATVPVWVGRTVALLVAGLVGRSDGG